jgi:hypothetical protein
MVKGSHATTTELTLKTRRILLRSDFQPMIVSLSFFAWRSRETTFCLPFLMISLWISANVLRPRASLARFSGLTAADLTYDVSCLIASHTGSLRSFNIFPSNPRLRAVQTSVQASPSSTQSSSFVIDSCMLPISLRSINVGDAGINPP